MTYQFKTKSFPLAIKESVPSTHHDGELAADIFAPSGTPWLAVLDGIVVTGDYPEGGYTSTLTANDGTEAYYAHGMKNRVSGRVHAGDVIGYVDNSGNAVNTPSHLHFAVGIINSNGGGTISPAIWLSDQVPQTQNLTDYRSIAIQYAHQYGIDPDIFCAQIQQESGFDPWSSEGPPHPKTSSAGALGIAQFMPKTAAGLGIDPTNPNDSLRGAAMHMRQLLDMFDNNYPSALAAYNAGPGTVQKYGGVPPITFANGETYNYVHIILGNVGHQPANTSTTSPTFNMLLVDAKPGGQANSSSPTGQGGPPAFFSGRNEIVFPKTNLQVVPGSNVFGDILYGRRYRVIVSSLEGDVAFDVSNLKCTFTCVKYFLPQPYYSTIKIYNLKPEHENVIIEQGYRVVLEAGYSGSQYGQIFDGNVIQPVRNKEEGTTFTLELVSMDADMFFASGTASFTTLRGMNSREVIENLLAQSSVPTELGRISPNLSTAQLPRGKVVFGMAKDILRQMAKSEKATSYMDAGKINFVTADDLPDGEIISLSPKTGLIGVPVQQDYGASIRMQLNPKIKIGSMIYIDNSLIRNQQYAVGQPIYVLDQDGLYRVIKLTHVGDTRGDDWYTEVETVTQVGILPNMVSEGNQSPFG